MLAIIQARMSSKRLPGKMLMKLANKTVLEWVYNRVSKTSLVSKTIVATSNDTSDDILNELCKLKHIEVFRGPLNNVSKRFLDCAAQNNAKEFIRITGDSPFIDSYVIEKGIESYLSGKYDIVTNVQNRSFPKGQSVEILKFETFFNTFKKMRLKQDLEHVTNYFYKNPSSFKIKNFSCFHNYGHINLSIDTIDDFGRLERIVKKLGEEFSWLEASQETDKK